jgi:6-phosphogluconolactonase
MSTAIERAFVYVANAESRELLAFTLDLASGELTLSEHLLGGKFTTLAFTPNRRSMFAGLRDEPFGIASFSVDPASGVLQQLAETRMPGALAFLATDRTGRWLLAASYHSNCVLVSEIDSGRLREPHQVIESIPQAHAILTAPSNEFVVATSLGSDALLAWRFDATSGRLLEQGRVEHKLPAGSGPRHLRFHPRGNRLYVLCELDGSVRAFEYDAATLRLQDGPVASAVPKGFRGKRWAAELQITPDGKFMYASERTSSTLTTFRTEGAGALENHGSISTERQPRAFTIDPTGRYLLVVGQKSNRLGTYAIDRERGTLTKLNEYAVGDDPCWIEAIAAEP